MYANFRRQIKIRMPLTLTEQEADGWGNYRDAQGELQRRYFVAEQKQFLARPNSAGLSSIKLQFMKQGVTIVSLTIKHGTCLTTYDSFSRATPVRSDLQPMC